MITINNQALKDAVEMHTMSQSKIAHHADLSPDTLAKILKGDTGTTVTSLKKIASFLGLKVEVRFAPVGGDEE